MVAIPCSTPVTMLNDEQTTFTFGNDQEYNPRNYKDEYHGEVTATYALAHSLNNATISLAQMVGFGNVASLARIRGHSHRARHTLGSVRHVQRHAVGYGGRVHRLRQRRHQDRPVDAGPRSARPPAT